MFFDWLFFLLSWFMILFRFGVSLMFRLLVFDRHDRSRRPCRSMNWLMIGRMGLRICCRVMCNRLRMISRVVPSYLMTVTTVGTVSSIASIDRLSIGLSVDRLGIVTCITTIDWCLSAISNVLSLRCLSNRH